MRLLWKLLRQHISISQFCGFLFANLFGMIIVLAGYQFYNDVVPVFTCGDSFMRPDYLLVTKRIGTGNTLSGRTSTFSAREQAELQSQDFTKKIGAFTSSNYKVHGRMGINGQQILNTEMYLESIPDDFVELDTKEWHYEAGSDIVPIIMPRTYINMYNFGFAQSHSLPQISEGLMGMIDLDIMVRGNGKQHDFKGKVIAFSSSVTSILVPQSFMELTNNEFAPDEDVSPTRLLMEVTNPADETVTKYFDRQGYEIDSDELEAEKTTYFLRMIVSLVMMIGVIISVLSFYILMLSIYLLVQKNTKKLQNLLLIGYPARRVAMPYQMLTAALNVAVLAIALVTVFFLRSYYMNILEALYPEVSGSTMLHSFILGGALLIVVTCLNTFIIRNKIRKL